MNANILIGMCKGRSSCGRTMNRSEGYSQMWVFDSNGSIYSPILGFGECVSGPIKGKKLYLAIP